MTRRPGVGRGILGLVGASAVACAPAVTSPSDGGCVTDPPDAGILLAPVRCGAQLPDGSEAAVAGDVWIANPTLRGILRGPERALSLPGVSGGTLIDLASWDGRDVLVEAVPLIAGHVLDVADATADPTGLTLTGVLAPLPGERPGAEAGDPASIRWTADPDGPWLIAEGADAMMIHAGPDAVLLDGWLWVGDTVIGHDGTTVRDLGGAIVAEGATRILSAPLDQAWGWRPEGGVSIGGLVTPTSADATVEAWTGDTRVAVLDVDDDGRFHGLVPASATRVRATAPARASSEDQTPGRALELTLGPLGTLQVLLAWPEDVAPRPVQVRWTVGDRAGKARLDPTGGFVATGAGTVQLTVDAGPALTPATAQLDVPADGITRIRVGLDAPGAPPPGHQLGALRVADGRGRQHRALPAEVLRDAVGTGRSFVAFADDHLGARAAAFADDEGWITAWEGATLRHPDGGAITVWPLAGNTALDATDIPRIPPGATLDDALRRAVGALSAPRTALVDLSLLDRHDGPWDALAAPPDLVWLPSPGPAPFVAWRPWLDLLHAARPPAPAGPLLWWASDSDPSDPDPNEPARVIEGRRFVATTGPWMALTVDGIGPGGVVAPEGQDEDRPHLVAVEVAPGSTALDRVSLVGRDGVLHTWTIPADERMSAVQLRALPRVVTGIAWSTADPDVWAVTAPITVRPPTGAVPHDTALETSP